MDGWIKLKINVFIKQLDFTKCRSGSVECQTGHL